MINLKELELYKNNCDIADIINDIKKLDNLIDLQDWCAAQEHTEFIGLKYKQELVVYNVINNTPAFSI